VFPVEYKHGPKRKWLNDNLQLAAQAMCLENMLGRAVPRGANNHASCHRRREVATAPPLREKVIETAEAIRAMLAAGRLPPPVNNARCRECSLKDICQPEAMAESQQLKRLREELFNGPE